MFSDREGAFTVQKKDTTQSPGFDTKQKNDNNNTHSLLRVVSLRMLY